REAGEADSDHPLRHRVLGCDPESRADARMGRDQPRRSGTADQSRRAGGSLRLSQGAPDDASPRFAGRRDACARDSENALVVLDAVLAGSLDPAMPTLQYSKYVDRSFLNALSSSIQPAAISAPDIPASICSLSDDDPASMSMGILSCSYSYGGWRHANFEGF